MPFTERDAGLEKLGDEPKSKQSSAKRDVGARTARERRPSLTFSRASYSSLQLGSMRLSQDELSFGPSMGMEGMEQLEPLLKLMRQFEFKLKIAAAEADSMMMVDFSRHYKSSPDKLAAASTQSTPNTGAKAAPVRHHAPPSPTDNLVVKLEKALRRVEESTMHSHALNQYHKLAMVSTATSSAVTPEGSVVDVPIGKASIANSIATTPDLQPLLTHRSAITHRSSLADSLQPPLSARGRTPISMASKIPTPPKSASSVPPLASGLTPRLGGFGPQVAGITPRLGGVGGGVTPRGHPMRSESSKSHKDAGHSAPMPKLDFSKLNRDVSKAGVDANPPNSSRGNGTSRIPTAVPKLKLGSLQDRVSSHGEDVSKALDQSPLKSSRVSVWQRSPAM